MRMTLCRTMGIFTFCLLFTSPVWLLFTVHNNHARITARTCRKLSRDVLFQEPHTHAHTHTHSPP